MIIIASALFLGSCASTKAAAQAEGISQTSARQTQDVKLRLISGASPSVPITADLVVPVGAIAALPEGAEYSSHDDGISVSVSRKGKDSIHVRATGLKNPTPAVEITAESSGHTTLLDSTASKTEADISPKPRGQPHPDPDDRGELMFIIIIFLLLIGMIAYESHKHKTTKNYE